jgi:hypothetical protein
MFTIDASAMSALAYQADVPADMAADVQRQPKPSRSAPYNPMTPAKAANTSPAPITGKRVDRAPLPLPGEPANAPANPAHPPPEKNQALPPPPPKTTAPRTVDATGNPLPLEHTDQPPPMADAPVTPPPPEGRDQLDSPGQNGKGSIPPAPPPPRKTTKTPKNPERSVTPPPPAPPPGPDTTTRSPWSRGQ